MAVVEFRPPSSDALQFIADTMRKPDQVEVEASNGFSPSEAVTEGVKLSDFSTVAYVNGVPCCVFGLTKGDLLSGTGVPWMLSSEEVLKFKREILLHSRQVVGEMLVICPHLVNYVHADNIISVRWLKWLGFVIEKPAPYGPSGQLFHRFSMRKA